MKRVCEPTGRRRDHDCFGDRHKLLLGLLHTGLEQVAEHRISEMRVNLLDDDGRVTNQIIEAVGTLKARTNLLRTTQGERSSTGEMVDGILLPYVPM